MLAIKTVTSEGKELDIVRELFADYQKELGEDLCFQSFDAELKAPLKKYGPPSGIIYLAYYNNEVAGCIALMPLSSDDGIKTCEMKRLYVKPEHRQHKVGKALVEQLINTAKELGYERMKLDTLQKLQPAIQLYVKYGFLETTSYYENPLPGVVYMQKELSS
jgi:putative acetyltransferase